MASKVPHVVILGGGFGGLEAAKAFRNKPVKVTLVDKRNHHLFQPLLYQVATAALSAPDIAAPIRKLLASQANTTVLLGRALEIRAQENQLVLTDGVIDYDYLIVAAGMTNGYFGRPDWEKYAPGLKSLEEALEIRRRVLLAYESAEKEADAEKRQEWLTFVVIGGGPTGVELAGALAEIAHKTMATNFRNFNPPDAQVFLLEGGDRLLPAMPEDLSARVKSDLESLGVEVRLGKRVSEINEYAVELGDERILSRTVLWGAGVKGVPIGETIGAEVDRAGRVVVNQDLRAPGLDNLYVVGDLAKVRWGDDFVPGVAPAAIQQGQLAAKNILATIAGQPTAEFEYFDKGSMATIGRKRAVAVAGKLKLTGFIAWLAWLFVHVMTLVGFRNRAAVLFEWAWAYVSYQRSARLILGRSLALPSRSSTLPASSRFIAASENSETEAVASE